MTTKDFNNWSMYHEIQKLHIFGHSKAKIAAYLVMDPRTVKKYLEMSEEEFEQTLVKAREFYYICSQMLYVHES